MQKHDVITNQGGWRPNQITVLSRQIIVCLAAAGLLSWVPTMLQAAKRQPRSSPVTSDVSAKAGSDWNPATTDGLGVQFIAGSSSSIIVNRNGKKYVIDLASRTIREVESPKPVQNMHSQEIALLDTTAKNTQLGAKIFVEKCSMCHGKDGKGMKPFGTPDFTSSKVQASLTKETIINTIKYGRKGTLMPVWEGKLSNDEIVAVGSFVEFLGSGDSAPQRAAATAAKENAKIYTPADDYLFSLPTGRRLDQHGFYVNFTHRFAFDTAFGGKARGAVLDGLDGFSVSSFGFRYGITDRLSVSAYRSPSVIGRPVELMAAYHFLDEHDGYPLNATFRFSVDGQNNFSKNFTTNFEGIFSRSLFNRTQFYVVPTLSLQNRRLIADPILEDPPPDLPGVNSFSLGLGGAFDIRPTVAVIAEVIPTLVNGRELGIHRPAYAFGIQKRLWRHAFTLGFSNSPGTVVSQRAGTRATFLGDPSADTPSGLFIGFDLMRQMN
jgi:mono/diheme cytochrome c family protein